MDIGVIGAFLGGVLALLSPCSAVLLPGFFAYAFGTRRSLAGRTALFYAGLLVTLVPLGVAASSLGALLNENRHAVIVTVSVLLVALGLAQLLGLQVPLPGRTSSHRRDARSGLSVFLLGTAYGVAGVCSGPILGSVLAVAALGDSPLYGALVLAVYALGMTVPMLLLALLWDRFGLARSRWLRPRGLRVGPVTTTLTGVIGGVLFVGIGVLLLVTEGTGSLSGVIPIEVQYEIESRLARWASAIPPYVGIAVLVVVLAFAAFVYAGRRAAADERDE